MSSLDLMLGAARIRAAKANGEVILAEFQKAVEKRDWKAAEDARVRYLAATEAMLDEYMALYRAMQPG